SAVVGGMLAKASHDTGEPHAAMLQARTAYLCAEQADHPGLRGWLRGLQSMVAYWAGRHREAVRYAEQGMQYATIGSGTTAVWLPVSAARAHAALGDVDSAVTSIRRAETAWDNVHPDEVDELGGLCTFTLPRTLYYAADALAWTPGHDDGEAYAERAVAAYADQTDPAWAFGDEAGARTDLAIARVARGELEGAAEVLAPVLELTPERRINGIRHSVQRVHAALTASPAVDAAPVGAMQEEIEGFLRTPVAALPR
ncbi:XRE family transcriptional regulator, partial [Couchioplanes azureus]|uniref:XRE family transcriptional regulator n=2 Tax=Couchioplanes caeruleus TaxID=56438 RepID=UPI00166FD34D